MQMLTLFFCRNSAANSPDLLQDKMLLDGPFVAPLHAGR